MLKLHDLVVFDLLHNRLRLYKDQCVKLKFEDHITSYRGAMKIEKMIKPFNCEGYIELWLKKVKLVAKLKKTKGLATVIPMFLECQTYMMYDHLSAEDKENADKIEKPTRRLFH